MNANVKPRMTNVNAAKTCNTMFTYEVHRNPSYTSYNYNYCYNIDISTVNKTNTSIDKYCNIMDNKTSQ